MTAGQGVDCDGARERRAHRRLNIRLPIECRKEGENTRYLVRTITQNVSSGGVYLELDSADFQPGAHMHIELTVPPAEGVSPYPGRASCMSEVLRVRRLSDRLQSPVQRFGVAARFLDRLRISY